LRVLERVKAGYSDNWDIPAARKPQAEAGRDAEGKMERERERERETERMVEFAHCQPNDFST
jgi:hypothetical protein